jgi:CheY-like chemotaxis protein
LLDLSKLDAGVVTPNLSIFPIAEMLATLVSVHAPEARLKGLRLRCVPSRLSVHSDTVLFRRMLGNLIANAIRYTERGGVLIGCRRRQGKTWVEVWDSGIGIAEHQTQEIFEEFRQLGDAARNRGSGLGLAIVAKTAALLGLEVAVRSWPGRGSVFAIELPVPTAPPIEPETPMFEERAWTCRALCIALVEDNLIVRQALAYALQDIGHQVLAAASGAELQAQLDSLRPDVIITDYRLAAGETGFDVIATVRAALGDDLPAILITGDTDPDLMRSMVDRGIIVLHKPVQIETLAACLAGF